MIPRIEVTSIFTGSQIANTRADDYRYYRCNESYYDVSLDAALGKCKELWDMTATYVYNGATREYQLTSIF